MSTSIRYTASPARASLHAASASREGLRAAVAAVIGSGRARDAARDQNRAAVSIAAVRTAVPAMLLPEAAVINEVMMLSV